MGEQTTISTIVPGGVKPSTGRSALAASITSRQIGAAPARPGRSIIGAPSALPTQTPTARSGVTPTAQLSRNCEVVPVFTAAGKGVSSAEPKPNAGARASGSLRMSASRNACSAVITRSATRGARSYSRSPVAASCTRSIA